VKTEVGTIIAVLVTSGLPGLRKWEYLRDSRRSNAIRRSAVPGAIRGPPVVPILI